MIIEYYTKEVYGKPMEYIVDEKINKTIQTITGLKCLSPNLRQHFTVLGLEFKEVIQPK